MVRYDNMISEKRELRAKYIQHSVASGATDTVLEKESALKELIEKKYDDMDGCNPDEWEAWIA